VSQAAALSAAKIKLLTLTLENISVTLNVNLFGPGKWICEEKILDYVINRAKRWFSSSSPECALKLKKLALYLGLELTMYVLKSQISLKKQFLVLCYVAT
jgi:hypothetical protein